MCSLVAVWGLPSRLEQHLFEHSSQQDLVAILDARQFGPSVRSPWWVWIPARPASIATPKGTKALLPPGGCARIEELAASLARSDELLKRAERSSMEFSEARLEFASGNENLIKTEVELHSFDSAVVDASVN